MLTLFLLGIALLIGLILFGRWYVTAEPKEALKALKWIGIGFFIIISCFFVFTGRLSWAFFGIPVLLPWLMRARAVARAAKTFKRMMQSNAGVKSGNTSDVKTRFFKMTLDHDSGDMSGSINEGDHSGADIEDLTTQQLIVLLNTCLLEDVDSARILEAYLDRNRPDWHDFVDGYDASSQRVNTTSMDRALALQILGLSHGVTDNAIKEAHRKLISGMHPDHGGSNYLAAQINQAKDVLLGN
jgi:hypothetical protein